MKASEVATELRKFADALDKAPDGNVRAYMAITATDKESFLSLARVMPRPIEKKIDFEGTTYEDYVLTHKFLYLRVRRSEVCILVEPAKPARFECPSLLSAEEEAELGTF